jgi:hypothetical protein
VNPRNRALGLVFVGAVTTALTAGCGPGTGAQGTPASAPTISKSTTASTGVTPVEVAPSPTTPIANASAANAAVSQALSQVDAGTSQIDKDLSAGDSARTQNDNN